MNTNSKQLTIDRNSLPTHFLDRDELIGIELGVAKGGYSKFLVETGKFKHFFGVDMYADQHDTAQYISALKEVGIYSQYKLFRMTFKEALELFEDESLDFVYIDGYAHTGEEGGETIFDWARKVKVGGVIAGHDYHPEWPLVVDAVDDFVARSGLDLNVTEVAQDPHGSDKYPSWVVVKTKPTEHEALAEMVERGKKSDRRTTKKAPGFGARVKRAVAILLGPRVIAFLNKLRRRSN